MHQASILFTAAVMAMAGAWYVMQDMTRADEPETATAAVEQTIAGQAEAEMPVLVDEDLAT